MDGRIHSRTFRSLHTHCLSVSKGIEQFRYHSGNTGGVYILGSKIVELDYQTRTSDPTIFVGKTIMQSLSQFYNDQMLNIHEERTEEKLPLQEGDRTLYFKVQPQKSL